MRYNVLVQRGGQALHDVAKAPVYATNRPYEILPQRGKVFWSSSSHRPFPSSLLIFLRSLDAASTVAAELRAHSPGALTALPSSVSVWKQSLGVTDWRPKPSFSTRLFFGAPSFYGAVLDLGGKWPGLVAQTST